MAALHRATLYVNTVRHMRPRQVASQIARRVVRSPSVVRPRERQVFVGLRFSRPFLPAARATSGDGRLSFLNSPECFVPEKPDWVASDMPKLWRYNLHYFDFLHWASGSADRNAALIDSWLEHVPPGQGDGWEPYPLSVRIVNWLKFLHGRSPDAIPDAWTESLATQMGTLRASIEHHLLGNHLLKNAKALLLGGAAFKGAVATEWLQQGLRILRTELREQILADGGHIERSPMYHSIVLEDILDIINVLQAGQELVSRDARAEIFEAGRRATAFLRQLRGGNGEIPLFNDSAYGVAPPAVELLEYAERILEPRESGVELQDRGGEKPPGRICLADSGYFGYRSGGDSLLLDCGPVGPDYQPGHAHCDTLSFELCVAGRPVVVDSGVHEYAAGPRREYDRSTRAHNTVMVDDEEQSEMWGALRVARRAQPLFARLDAWSNGLLHFHGGHDGYHRIAGRVTHEREFFMHEAGRWEVRDHLRGRGRHRIRSFIHLHPDCAVERATGGQWRIAMSAGPRLSFAPFGGTVRLEQGCYSPGFGLRIANPVLVIEQEGPLPMECGYVLQKLPAGVR
jgi:uncharacterized heparinase superfamily protein